MRSGRVRQERLRAKRKSDLLVKEPNDAFTTTVLLEGRPHKKEQGRKNKKTRRGSRAWNVSERKLELEDPSP